MDYNIKIDPNTLHLSDHDLYLKLYNEIENKHETIDFQALQEQITKEINLARPNREYCLCCDGAGMVRGLKCIGGCFGKGYIE